MGTPTYAEPSSPTPVKPTVTLHGRFTTIEEDTTTTDAKLARGHAELQAWRDERCTRKATTDGDESEADAAQTVRYFLDRVGTVKSHAVE